MAKISHECLTRSPLSQYKVQLCIVSSNLNLSEQQIQTFIINLLHCNMLAGEHVQFPTFGNFPPSDSACYV